jgi:16S rRNA (cytosine967-C5)-methyltransferase
MNDRVYAAPSLAQQLGLCARVVRGVREGQSLSRLLPDIQPSLRPGVQALSFHVLRWMGAAQAVRRLLAPRRPPPNVEALLLSALALLWPPSGPPHAPHVLVDQAVAAARRLDKRSAGFVNGVLRRFLRESEALVTRLVEKDPLARWNHPDWWVARLRADWPPAQAQAILEAAQDHPPMALRVNRRRTTPQALALQLADAGHACRPLPHGLAPEGALVLAQPCPVQALPGFAEGLCSVQDVHAQWAASLLLAHGPALKPAARVLDACAAPGGKTAHLLELADLDLLALDHDPARLAQVEANLERLGLHASCRAADAGAPDTWWDGRPFDAILLDAPCTGSGIVRRHPDARWLKRESDLSSLAAEQARLLAALWPLLKPGGRLLYATCSVFKAEGLHQIDAFLQRLGPGQVRLDDASPGHLLPLPENGAAAGEDGRWAVGDGFFYALLHKSGHAEAMG